MRCVRCGGGMRRNDGAYQSSLHSGRSETAFVRGYSCIMCGAWVDIGRPIAEQRRAGLTAAENAWRKQKGAPTLPQLLTDLYPQICRMREEGKPWWEITKVCNLPFHQNTVNKQFHKLQERLHGNRGCEAGD